MPTMRDVRRILRVWDDDVRIFGADPELKEQVEKAARELGKYIMSGLGLSRDEVRQQEDEKPLPEAATHFFHALENLVRPIRPEET